MRLAESVAIVTGGASGLGAATVDHIVRRGGRVAMMDTAERDRTGADDFDNSRILELETDITDRAQVDEAVRQVVEEFGRIDAVVNAAGVNPGGYALGTENGELALDDLQAALSVNVAGTFSVIHHVAGAMSRQKPGPEGERGVIVNVASIAAYEGQVGHSAYAASKAAVIGLTLPLARELAPLGIRVMCVAPGFMNTPMLDGLGERNKNAFAALEVFPRRPGKPEEFAWLVGCIVENTMLNGEVIRLDGAVRLAHTMIREEPPS